MSIAAPPQKVLELLASLAKQIHEVHIRSEAHSKATHERFNVFTTLLGETDEVRLHTRFLQCLLDPNGRHDCGPLFLTLFFATLDEIPGLNHHDEPAQLMIPASGKSWTVSKEQSRHSHGQIDLLLERTDFGIAIENKINAHEQDRQLAAYADYLKQCYGSSWRLVYLTKDGKKSETAGDNPYLRISYREHILAWLEKCMRETYHIIPVNQSLQQYHKVVREITGKTIDNSAMKPITEFILRNPDIIKYNQQIIDSINEARASFLDQLADVLTTSLEARGLSARLRANLSGGRFGMDRYGALFVQPPANSVLREAPFVICVENDTDLKDLVVGLTLEPLQDRVTAEDNELLKRMDALLKADSVARGYHKNNPNGGWPTGWHNLLRTDDAGIAKLIETGLSNTVAKVSDTICQHVELLERIYKESKLMAKPT